MSSVLENTQPNAENTMDEGVATKSDESADFDHTVGYIVSTDEDEDDFDSSDEEPLSKYVIKYSALPELEPIVVTPGIATSTSNAQQKRGRPRGHTKPKSKEYISGFNIVQRHVHQDRVDEECAEWGIVYKSWELLDPEQDSHASIMDVGVDTIIPEVQNIPDCCILCPRNKFL